MVARHDQVTDPVLLQSLLQARRGTAFFARKLNELPDAQLDAPSLLPGWAIARLIEWAATGIETPMYSSPEARDHEIEFGATLSPIALRHLFDHSAVHLNVEWRDLPADAWHHKVKTAQGRVVPAEETVWMRTREVWLHAVDLDSEATFNDVPAPVLERLLADIAGSWHTRGTDTGLLINVDDTDLSFCDTGAADPTIISGQLTGIVQWAAGRGTVRITASGAGAATGTVPAAPKWI